MTGFDYSEAAYVKELENFVNATGLKQPFALIVQVGWLGGFHCRGGWMVGWVLLPGWWDGWSDRLDGWLVGLYRLEAALCAGHPLRWSPWLVVDINGI